MDVKSDHIPSCNCFGNCQTEIEIFARRRLGYESTRRGNRSAEKNPYPVEYEHLDICSIDRSAVVEEGIEVKHLKERDAKILRPGMVLLKHYLTIDEQVQIVKECRELGVGRGGFFQPTFRNRSKLHLQMMCLGLHWDHETRIYSESRSLDGVKPASIPFEFNSMVKRVMKYSHNLIEEETKEINPERILPRLSPDVCIVNFYTTTGRLGLHQDRDESKTSLRRGLPVVSFSIGDSAKFLYGDTRIIEDSEEVELESGDVLIFGGESRHVFHGVSTILPNSAPTSLLKKTNLLSGRLNLTFRQN
ncbi:alpha-ketoglutarate-dependent dioxygenase abh1-like isoform X2 [Impatiens glandulifera]|uniref:alpha-ketoglutarate-dependent dioxygenase abh1-like isoform X2 n=1 Tax=Impatiens glandulifera TaxID=253017 RepID=UPI001FB15224|nr:alpha-ketoglutarate-dependent dioxygenase abh1-like isoform X2 [Impatiens glandulifera]